MQTYEYKAVPAPNRPKRVKGVKTTAGRFAALLTDTMNDLAREGWEYLRSDSLPVEEKPGLLKSRVETYLTILVFRRPLGAASAAPESPMAGYIEDHSESLPADPAPVPEHTPEPVAEHTAAPVAEPVYAPEPEPQQHLEPIPHTAEPAHTPDPAPMLEPIAEPAIEWPPEPKPQPRATPSWINPETRQDPPLRAPAKHPGEDSPFAAPTDRTDER